MPVVLDSEMRERLLMQELDTWLEQRSLALIEGRPVDPLDYHPSHDRNSDLEAQLRRFTAFSQRARPSPWLARNVSLFQAPVGQELLARDVLPDHCFGILEGRGRLLHHDPGVRRPLTLALCCLAI